MASVPFHYVDLRAFSYATEDDKRVEDALRLFLPEEFDRLGGELDERVDENCSFFVSLSKQAAFNGEVRLGDGLTLRGKVEAYPAKKEQAIDAVAETFGVS